MGVTTTARNRNATPSQKTAASSNPTEKGPTYNDGESDEFEFGGSFGAASLMVGFPLLMWYMWIGATYYDGHLPLPAADQTLNEFIHHLANMVYKGAYPTAKAWAIYWTFFIVEALMFVLLRAFRV
jgi:delta24(24(1))-sterol reductase